MKNDPDKCASLWFLRLETAREKNDRRAESEARRKLKALGITVTFRKAVQHAG